MPEFIDMSSDHVEELPCETCVLRGKACIPLQQLLLCEDMRQRYHALNVGKNLDAWLRERIEELYLTEMDPELGRVFNRCIYYKDTEHGHSDAWEGPTPGVASTPAVQG